MKGGGSLWLNPKEPMPRAKKVCAQPGCPQPAGASYCTEHTRARDKARGTKAQRGYGADYQAQRRRWVAKVAQGNVCCWRCQQPLASGALFHLGHDDDDRSIIRGPECPRCNLSAAGKAAHRYDS